MPTKTPSKTSTKAVVKQNAKDLAKAYDPKSFETSHYEFWEQNHCFDARDENLPGQESFCIVIPPPNVTGVLHMGHALTNTIQDILIRWRRMKGDNTLWLPGTDHAGIATQAQVEKHIAKEKGPSGKPLNRHDLGREEFLKRVWAWKEDHGHQITGQLKRLGSSLDWKRERFTMDDGCSRAVREVFVRLYQQELIYRGERIINWCPRCQTALSDLEVIPTERKGYFWHLLYPVVESDGTPVKGSDGNPVTIEIATTRPETMLGDTAVAVHPEDERHKAIHGKFVKLPLINRIIPIIQDDYVDKEFGSGGLKVTPAHDFNDYEIGQRHDLPNISVISKEGRITPAGGPYASLSTKEARERIVQDLKERKILIKTEDHTHHVGLCQRCDSVAEPLISKQWFVKIQPLADKAIDAVKKQDIQFTPRMWEKTYFEWMNNIRDWCISRQLWWGHQIPAWYCGRCQHITVAIDHPKNCENCKADAKVLKQDDDVLDTWFSSALWPFATMGWPEKTKPLKTFYPGAILETGFDIIFFWVARMIMMGIHFMGEVPFHRVYLHAMVRDEKGQKMSKSKGNVVDPLVLIDQYGADPLRFTLAFMAGQGRDIKLSEERVLGFRAFCNKIWNAVRFFHHQMGQKSVEMPEGGAEAFLLKRRLELSPINRWILSELHYTISKVVNGLVTFQLDQATQGAYEFVWHEFCDWYIELSKLSLSESDEERRDTLVVLHYVLETSLRLLHPFIPFVTEELWQSLPWKTAARSPNREAEGLPPIETIMLQAFPEMNSAFQDAQAKKSVDTLKSVIEAIRNFRGENKVPPNQKIVVQYIPGMAAADAFMKMNAEEIKELAKVSTLERLELGTQAGKSEAVIPVTNPPLELRIDLSGLVDVDGETKRLAKEIERLQSDISHIQRKLANAQFVEKAPKELIAKEREKEKAFTAQLKELENTIARLKSK